MFDLTESVATISIVQVAVVAPLYLVDHSITARQRAHRRLFRARVSILDVARIAAPIAPTPPPTSSSTGLPTVLTGRKPQELTRLLAKDSLWFADRKFFAWLSKEQQEMPGLATLARIMLEHPSPTWYVS